MKSTKPLCRRQNQLVNQILVAVIKNRSFDAHLAASASVNPHASQLWTLESVSGLLRSIPRYFSNPLAASVANKASEISLSDLQNRKNSDWSRDSEKYPHSQISEFVRVGINENGNVRIEGCICFNHFLFLFSLKIKNL